MKRSLFNTRITCCLFLVVCNITVCNSSKKAHPCSFYTPRNGCPRKHYQSESLKDAMLATRATVDPIALVESQYWP